MKSDEREAMAFTMLLNYVFGDDSDADWIINRHNPRVFPIDMDDNEFVGVINLPPEDCDDDIEYSLYHIHVSEFMHEPGQVSVLHKKRTEDIFPHVRL